MKVKILLFLFFVYTPFLQAQHQHQEHNFEETDDLMKLFKYYPMVKLQLNYRLF